MKHHIEKFPPGPRAAGRAIITLLPALFFLIISAGAAESVPPDTALSTYTVLSETRLAEHSGPVSAPDAVAVGTQPPAAVMMPSGYAGPILNMLKHLPALLGKGTLVDQTELNAVVKEIAALDARIIDLLGASIIRELEDREKERTAKAELLNLRSLLLAYYGDNEGKYPASPEELIPKYISSIPALELPGHPKTNVVELNRNAGGEPAKEVTDTGGWLYFADPGSSNFGMLILNCSHKDGRNHEYFQD